MAPDGHCSPSTPLYSSATLDHYPGRHDDAVVVAGAAFSQRGSAHLLELSAEFGLDGNRNSWASRALANSATEETRARREVR